MTEEHAVKVKVLLKSEKEKDLEPTPTYHDGYKLIEPGYKAIDVTGISVTQSGLTGVVQNFLLPDGDNLITTACGVAPPGLAYKCFWLRTYTHKNNTIKWKLVTEGGSNYQILIPMLKEK